MMMSPPHNRLSFSADRPSSPSRNRDSMAGAPSSRGVTSPLAYEDQRSLNETSGSSSRDSSSDIDTEVDEQAEEVVADLNIEAERKVPLSAALVRVLALLCACSLSIGSHYGSYFLGPLKSRLSREIGTSNTEFSLLIAAYNLNNTWTPLVGGVMAARLGTGLSSIIATSLILVGQVILLIGDLAGNVKIMVFGLFIFGLGVSPLAVVQETIIVRFFSKHGLGISLALGLVAGKGTSFLSALTSYPLSQKYGPHAPFVVATVLAAFSFGFNLIYLLSAGWFARGARVAPEAADIHRRLSKSEGDLRLRVERPNSMPLLSERMSEREALEKVAAKRNVKFWDLTKLGDVFWLYIGINALCGIIWSPFTHLAANIFEKRYVLSENDASRSASLLLAGSIVLYPLCGYLTDRLKRGPIVHHLFVLSSCLTLFCYFWLVLPPSWTKSPMPAIFAFGGGHGFSTLLLVIIVPHIVPIQYVSTALGAHKSLESAGSTTSKILAGLLLDSKSKSKKGQSDFSLSRISERLSPPIDNLTAIQWLLNAWLFVNVIQLIGTISLWKFDVRRKRRALLRGADENSAELSPSLRRRGGYLQLPAEALDDEEGPSLVKDAAIGANENDEVQRNPWLDEADRVGAHSPLPIRGTDDHHPTWNSEPGARSPLLPATATEEPSRHPHPSSSSPSPNLMDTQVASYTNPGSSSPPKASTRTRLSYLLPETNADGGEQSRSRRRSSRNISPALRRGRSASNASGNLHAFATRSKREKRRGKMFMGMSALLIAATWALFWGTVVAKIKQRNGSATSD